MARPGRTCPVVGVRPWRTSRTVVGFGPLGAFDVAFFRADAVPAFFAATVVVDASRAAAFFEVGFVAAALVAASTDRVAVDALRLVREEVGAGAIAVHGTYGFGVPADRPNAKCGETSADALAVVADDVANCRACPRLVAWREQVANEKRAAYAEWEYWGRGVPGFGDPAARLMVVGLAPAAHGANRTGRMFTGDRSGDWLYRAMYRAGFANQPASVDIDDGLRLSGAYVTSPVKCAPPANKPSTTERDTCRPFLDREIALLRPIVYVALGGFAYQGLAGHFGIKPRPKFGHGVEVEFDSGSGSGSGSVLLCSYHVSQQNTFTGRLTEPMLDAVFDRARRIIDERTT